VEAEALERGYTLPAEWYTDPAILRLEEERIFRHAWQYAGRADQVAEPGDYFTCSLGAVPIVVVRDREGALNAFVNVCRHRASEVVFGSGRRETLQCHYHAWTYGLDGSLRAAPRSDQEAGFDRSELSLLPAQTSTWGPFVFVNPDAEAPPLAEVLGDLPELVKSAGVDVDAVVFNRRADFQLGTNWKVASENYLECYHCPVAHPGFSAVFDVAPDSYRLEVSGNFSSQYGAVREKRTASYDPTGAVERGQFHFLWPNTKINILPGRPNISVGPLQPTGVDGTVGFLDYFFAPDTDEAWIEELIAFEDQVGAEDRTLVESVQRGLRSGMIHQGRLMPESEQLIADFQWRVRAALA
jgi:choline monooxygenase